MIFHTFRRWRVLGYWKREKCRFFRETSFSNQIAMQRFAGLVWRSWKHNWTVSGLAHVAGWAPTPLLKLNGKECCVTGREAKGRGETTGKISKVLVSRGNKSAKKLHYPRGRRRERPGGCPVRDAIRAGWRSLAYMKFPYPRRKVPLLRLGGYEGRGEKGKQKRGGTGRGTGSRRCRGRSDEGVAKHLQFSGTFAEYPTGKGSQRNLCRMKSPWRSCIRHGCEAQRRCIAAAPATAAFERVIIARQGARGGERERQRGLIRELARGERERVCTATGYPSSLLPPSKPGCFLFLLSCIRMYVHKYEALRGSGCAVRIHRWIAEAPRHFQLTLV